MNKPEHLSDRWHTRDFPVLVAAARKLDAGAQHLQVRDLEGDDFTFEEVIPALEAFVPTDLKGRDSPL